MEQTARNTPVLVMQKRMEELKASREEYRSQEGQYPDFGNGFSSVRGVGRIIHDQDILNESDEEREFEALRKQIELLSVRRSQVDQQSFLQAKEKRQRKLQQRAEEQKRKAVRRLKLGELRKQGEHLKRKIQALERQTLDEEKSSASFSSRYQAEIQELRSSPQGIGDNVIICCDCSFGQMITVATHLLASDADRF